MFCIHKWDEVKNGYQHCKKCNKAILVDKNYIFRRCNHKWEIIKDVEIFNDSFYGERQSNGFLYILKCSVRGMIDSRRIRP